MNKPKAGAVLFFLCVVLLLGISPAPAEIAADVDCPARVEEGTPFLCTITTFKRLKTVSVSWLKERVRPVLRREDNQYRALVLLPVGLNVSQGNHTLTIRLTDGRASTKFTKSIRVSSRQFEVQELTLDPGMVHPPSHVLKRIRRERKLVIKALNTRTPGRFWDLPLVRPVPGEITSSFGLRRVLNGVPKSSHKGVDFDGEKGDPVYATATGMVSLVDDQYYAGKSVFIDHGQGVISMYFHLSEVLVEENQIVMQGESVGRIGSTGRVTGPHLHFGVSVLGNSIDPLPLFVME